jgi:RecA-family ATPase
MSTETPAPDEGREASPELLPFTLFKDIKPDLEVHDFVQGLLVDGGLTVVVGEHKIGKTFWMLDLALHIASGLAWNGLRVDRGGVVYCTDGSSGFAKRVKAWVQSHPREEGIPFRFIQPGVNLHSPDLAEESDVDEVVAHVKAVEQETGMPVKLVVVDCLARALLGHDENSGAVLHYLLANVRRIQKETGANVCLVHGVSRNGEAARGFGRLSSAADTVIEISRPLEGANVREVSFRKIRDYAPKAPLSFRLNVVTLAKDENGHEITTLVVVPDDQRAAE